MYLCVCTYVCMYVYMYMYICKYVGICVYEYMYLCICLFTESPLIQIFTSHGIVITTLHQSTVWSIPSHTVPRPYAQLHNYLRKNWNIWRKYWCYPKWAINKKIHKQDQKCHIRRNRFHHPNNLSRSATL